MKSYRMSLALCVALLFLGLGCSQTENQRYFVLEARRDGQPQPLAKEGVLSVRPFSLSSGNHPKEFTYRTGAFQFESDYYNRFISDAGMQIADQTRQWLSDSGLFATVVQPGSTMTATYLLEGNITDLYCDFREEDNTQAVVRITFYLLEITNRKPEVVFHKTFQTTTAVPDHTVERFIEAYNESLRTILTNLEQTVVQSFQPAEN